MAYQIDAFGTIIAAVFVLLGGYILVQHINFFKKYNLPEPVVGGLIAAIITLVLFRHFNIAIHFNADIQKAFMLMFFTSVGLSASFAKLKEGGKGLFIFMICVSIFVIIQNAVGMGLATMLGLNPLIGMMTGSITLTGGHGTAAAWGSIFEEQYGIEGAIVLGMASATFGLIIAGILGGVVAKFLIKRHALAKELIQAPTLKEQAPPSAMVAPFEYPEKTRLITADDVVKTLGMFAICICFAQWMTVVAKVSGLNFPLLFGLWLVV